MMEADAGDAATAKGASTPDPDRDEKNHTLEPSGRARTQLIPDARIQDWGDLSAVSPPVCVSFPTPKPRDPSL